MLTTLDPTYEAFTARKSEASRAMAPPPRSLNGARVGLLANSKANGEALLDAVFQEVYRELSRTRGVELGEPLRFKKGDVTTPPTPEVFQRLVDEVDLVITAIGD